MQDNFELTIQAITEEAKTAIPSEIRQFYQSQKNRKLTAKKHKNSFLDEKRLKFPVKDPNGLYNCPLIYAAFMRGRINEQRAAKGKLRNDLGGGYYQRMGKHAKSLFDSCNCSKQLHIKLNQEDIGELDFIEFANLLQIEESMLIDEDFENDIDILN